MNDKEREAALALRAKFMAQVEELSLSPTGDSPTLGRPRKRMTDAERNALTERDALIGRPEEIIRRIKRLQEAGVEYIMVIDFAGSREHLRTFAREVMPAFATS
jgi:alkanesulfonate monooxygenase SsuD/methylene tetrahydromethanopterin reductase-like flavin-dependent oxidoreductase (luciferase family)